MARPTLVQQLSKAVLENNMEEIKKITEKLNAQKPKPKARAKSKEKIIHVVEEYEEDEEEEVESNGFMTHATKPVRQEIYDDEDIDEEDDEELDEDGEKTRTKAHTVPFKKLKNRQNLFSDGKDECLADVLENDSKPRNIKTRNPVQKIKAQCCRCNNKFTVWPGEILQKRWVCKQCLRG